MSGTQIGKTTIIKAVIGYHIDQDPCPILLVNPTLELAETFSKDRLAPMLRDTPCLRDKVADSRSRDSGNTILHKLFPGGHLTGSGANSPVSLGARPIRIVLQDEVDKQPASAGPEGDPSALADKRAATFWNRKKGKFGTPTIKGASRIDSAYENSDQGSFFLPCPHCGGMQDLKWSQFSFADEVRNDDQYPHLLSDDNPEDACYVCEHCEGVIIDSDKPWMLRNWELRSAKEFRGIAGFHVPEMYSPWVTFGQIAVGYMAAKKDTELMKVWVNTSLGLPYEEKAESFSHSVLIDRAEHYAEFEVPQAALILTAGVDVQGDRLEIVIKAWGSADESWIIYYGVIWGDTSVIASHVWTDLDVLTGRKYKKPNGYELGILATAIDSGFNTHTVYQYARARRRVMAVKGRSEPGRAILGRPQPQDVDMGGRVIKNGVKVWPIAVDTAKHHVFNRLKKTEPGPGYMHFYSSLPEDYYLGLCSEKLVTFYKHGVPHKVWKRCHARNEPLDLEVYAFAAAIYCGLGRLKESASVAVPRPAPEVPKSEPRSYMVAQRRAPPHTGGRGFVGRW